MGYTHYWRRSEHLDKDGFTKAAEEIKQVIKKAIEMGVCMAGPTGTREPAVDEDTIAFNGGRKCGHPYKNLGEPWPTPDARGIAADASDAISEGEPAFSGPYLKARSCGGNCAGEEFIVDRDWLHAEWHKTERGMFSQRCRTDYKPYDLVVTAALIRLKENLGDEIVISSDGDERAFADARRLCRQLFGWPEKFELEPKEHSVV